MAASRRVLARGKSLLPAVAQAQGRVQTGRLLEIAGVCGGLWASAAAVAPGSAVLLLGLLGTHLTVSEKVRKFLFFGLLARNAVRVELLGEETEEKLDLEISTDAGRRTLALVLDRALPEDSARVLFREMLDARLLEIPEEISDQPDLQAAAAGADEDARRILQRLRTENFVVVREESEIFFPETGKNFRLSDVTRERLQQRPPAALLRRATAAGASAERLLERQATQQLCVGALAVGVAAAVALRQRQPQPAAA